MSNKVLEKALSVTTGGLTHYLPTPLATEVVDYIRDVNIVRQLVDTIQMPARTYTIPTQASGMSAYYAPDGAEATATSFTSGSLTLTSKKLFAQCLIDMEAIEDSQPNIVQLVLKEFGHGVGEAEEYAFLQGNTSHTATAQTPAAASTANWYVGDSRVMFNGLFTLADSSVNSSCVDEVNAGNTVFAPAMVNQLLYNMGKYGRNKSKVICIMDSSAAANIRNNSTFQTAATSGLALSSHITGLDVGIAVTNGFVVNLFGVMCYEAPFAPSGKAVMFRKDSPVIGDRRAIKVASAPVIQTDQTRYVVSERIAFNNRWADSIGRITNLSTTIGS